MRFRLVSKSVTLNDLERRNGRYLRYFSEFGSFRRALCKGQIPLGPVPRNFLVTSLTSS